MIYEQKTTEQTIKVNKYDLSPCIKCGCNILTVEEYEDNFGCISTIKCSSCKQEIETQTSIPGVVKEWNKHNNIDIMLIDKMQLIEDTKEEIKALKVIKKQRRTFLKQ